MYYLLVKLFTSVTLFEMKWVRNTFSFSVSLFLLSFSVSLSPFSPSLNYFARISEREHEGGTYGCRYEMRSELTAELLRNAFCLAVSSASYFHHLLKNLNRKSLQTSWALPPFVSCPLLLSCGLISMFWCELSSIFSDHITRFPHFRSAMRRQGVWCADCAHNGLI